MQKYVIYIIIAGALVGVGYVAALKTAPANNSPKFASSTLGFPHLQDLPKENKPNNSRQELVIEINSVNEEFVFSSNVLEVQFGKPVSLKITNTAEACEFNIPEKNINESIASGEEIGVGFSVTTNSDIHFYCSIEGKQVGKEGVIHVKV